LAPIVMMLWVNDQASSVWTMGQTSTKMPSCGVKK
jgi:hypothetical protein